MTGEGARLAQLLQEAEQARLTIAEAMEAAGRDPNDWGRVVDESRATPEADCHAVEVLGRMGTAVAEDVRAYHQERAEAEVIARQMVYLDPGRPGPVPAPAVLEIRAHADRVPPRMRPLTSGQLTGTACLVCGGHLGMDSVPVGIVRQALAAGGKEFGVRVHVDPCAAPTLPPRRAPRPQPLGQRPETQS